MGVGKVNTVIIRDEMFTEALEVLDLDPDDRVPLMLQMLPIGIDVPVAGVWSFKIIAIESPCSPVLYNRLQSLAIPM